MSLLQNSNAISSGAYNITDSLRFRSSASAYLTRTPTSSGSLTTWTYSTWFKRGSLANTGYFFHSGDSISIGTAIQFNTSDQIEIYYYNTAYIWRFITSQVFRDTSAWYHLIVTYDSSNSTSSERMRLYINGNRVTAFGTSSSISLNQNTSINSNLYPHNISIAGSPFDGYMTEVNFVDGQALTPSDFGETNTNGVWSPIEYTGTYGTNGFYLPFNMNTTATYGGYTASVASNFPALPTGSQGSNFTFTGDFTIEGWVNFPSASGDNSLYVQSDGSTYLAWNIAMSTGFYNIYLNSGGVTSSIAHGMTVGQWNHVAMVRSGSTITLYTNGVAKGTITNSSTLGYSSLAINRFGGGAAGARYTSNVRITKSAVYTSAFTPPSEPLTDIANTVCLTYQSATLVDNSSNAYTITQTGTTTMSIQYPFLTGSSVANDQSGQGNNWTTNNISLTNDSTYDLMSDVPTLTDEDTANFATLSPLGPSGLVTNRGTVELLNGNLTNSDTANIGFFGLSYSSIQMNTGKFYFECVSSFDASSAVVIGVLGDEIIDHIGRAPATVAYVNDGTKMVNTTFSAYGSSFVANDVIGVAFDADAQTVEFYKNNVGQGSISVANSSFGGYRFYVSIGWSSGSKPYNHVNFGQRPFKYTPPTGYKKLNTFNLPDSSIKDGSQYFNTVTYTGTGATQSITGVGFQPDWVWFKRRSASERHWLTDAVRGSTKGLYSNSTDAEATRTDQLTSFDTDGFSLGVDAAGYTNVSGQSYVAWNWKASNSTAVSNTDGTITSTVSANTTSGFSVVAYTGNATTGATVGHGLGVAPNMYIIKDRDGVSNWVVFNDNLAANNNLYLNTTDAAFAAAGFAGMGATSSVLQLPTGGINSTNNSGTDYIAYAFHSVDGFSKFGSYTGNGSGDGTFVYTGFRPKFILVKRIDTAPYDWFIYDTSRDTYNVARNYLRPNLSDAEGFGFTYDILSNGFKNRSTFPAINASGGTYIYMAFAENPFKNSLAM